MALTQIVRSDYVVILRLGTRSYLARQTTKISFHFFAAPPRPPAARRKEEGRKFLVCAVGSVSKSSVRSLYFPYSAFSDFPSARGAPISAFGGNSSVRSHFAGTSHWSLTFVRDACSVPALCSPRGFGGVRGNSLCLPHPPCARTTITAVLGKIVKRRVLAPLCSTDKA